MTTDTSDADPRRFAPAAQRNRDAILAVLARYLPQTGVLIEVASGSGEHAAHIAPRLPGTLSWQPSDADATALDGINAHSSAVATDRIHKARHIDVTAADWHHGIEAAALFCANMIHIAPWSAAQGLFAGAGQILPPSGLLALYGPFRRNGDHTAPSNVEFDSWLKRRDDQWGVRDLEGEVAPLAANAGLTMHAIEEMPANNLIVLFEKGPAA